jgi:hypothetical protein
MHSLQATDHWRSAVTIKEEIMKRLGFIAALVLGASAAAAQEAGKAGHQHPATQAAAATAGATADKEALIRDALSAAPALIAKTAIVKDWDGTVLRQGNHDYTCFPTQADKRAKSEKEPMCLDKVWLVWGDAWMNKKPFKTDKIGIAYMLAGDTGGEQRRPLRKGKDH